MTRDEELRKSLCAERGHDWEYKYALPDCAYPEYITTAHTSSPKRYRCRRCGKWETRHD